MKRKLLYTGMAATLLLIGFQSTKTFAAGQTTDVKKSIVEINNISSLSKRDSKFRHLDVSRIFNKNLKSTNRNMNSFGRLSEENNYLFEQEPNNIPELANPMYLGVGEVGDFSYDPNYTGDLDLYNITVDEPGDLFVGGSTAYVVDGLTTIEFAVFDANLNLITTPDGIFYDPDTDITYEVMPNLEPGTYYIAAMNQYGIESYDQYMLYANMLDTTAPDAPRVNLIDDNDKVISGTAEANSLVTIKNGATTFKTVNVDASGNFKLSLTTPFMAGKKLYFTAEDAAGNISVASSVTVLDKTPPAPPKVNGVDDNDKSISGKAEAYSKITIKNGSKPFSTVNADKYGNFKLSIKPLKAGTKLYFTATDKNTNASKVSTVTVVDKTPPSTLTVNKVYRTSKYVSGKTEAKVSITVKVGSKILASGKSDSKGYYKLKIKSQKKNATLTITAKDSSGNTKTVKAKVR